MKEKLTPARLVVLNTLSGGPRTWKDLKFAYYGEDRNKSLSHTSFQNQLKKLVAKDIIMHDDGHYILTDKGRGMLESAGDDQLSAAKTVAQSKFEAQNQEVA